MLSAKCPKCMTKISVRETILSCQLQMLSEVGITQVVITTGPFEEILIDYCRSLGLPIEMTFVHNPDFQKTNYIYSIYLAREYLDDDILLIHGDLVFEYCIGYAPSVKVQLYGRQHSPAIAGEGFQGSDSRWEDRQSGNRVLPERCCGSAAVLSSPAGLATLAG